MTEQQTKRPMNPAASVETAASSDRELWREREGDYYADSIHVTKDGGIGINCGGTVIVKPLREWHALASRPTTPGEPRIDGGLGTYYIVRDVMGGHQYLQGDGKWHASTGNAFWPDRASALAFLTEVAARESGVTCPECSGSGKSGLVPLRVKPVEGHKHSEDELRQLADKLAVCGFCEGKGSVPAERLEWLHTGRLWRQARLRLHVGMREWAEKIGCLPSDYYEMEAGRLKPDDKYSPRWCFRFDRPAAARETQGTEPQTLFLSDTEVEAAWKQVCRDHIQPSMLFRLARHVAECSSCSQAFDVYRQPSAVAPQPEPAPATASPPQKGHEA